MTLPYDDPIRPNINLGITKLDIGSTPGHELDYLRDYFKDIVPQDLGIPSDSEPESALPETYDENDDQAFLDLDNVQGIVPGYNPYAGIQGQTAMLGIPQGLKLSAMLKGYLKNRLKYAGASTATNMLLEAKAKAEKKRIEQEKIKTAQDNWKPTYNPASSHKEAQATGGDYHSDTRSTVDGQTTEWGDELFSRGGLATMFARRR